MRLTLGIATWNRADLLAQVLDAVATLRPPATGATLRTIVVDNNSTDHTRQVVEATRPGMPVEYRFEPTQGKSFALNQLVAAARQDASDWLLLLDDDVLVDPSWLEAFVAAIGRYPDAACLGGPIEPWMQGKPSKVGCFLLEHYPAAFGVLRVPMDRPMSLPADTAYGANMALRLTVLPEKPFDPSRGMIGSVRVAGEDAAVQIQLLEKGHAGHLIADARVRHYTEAAQVSDARFRQWQRAIGAAWIRKRGKATEGQATIPRWHRRELHRRQLRALLRKRPWPTRGYYDALMQACQYEGWLAASVPESPKA